MFRARIAASFFRKRAREIDDVGYYLVGKVLHSMKGRIENSRTQRRRGRKEREQIIHC
jgi:hypothetical protein